MPRKRSGRGIDRTGRSKRDGRFIKLDLWLFDSPAYRSLSTVERCLYHELKRQYTGYNNGEVFLSVRDAAEALGVGKSTANTAFKTLQDRKFIVLNRKGAFNLKSDARRGMASTWILTEYPLGDRPPTNDFMHWRPNRKESTVQSWGQSVPVNGQTTETPPQVSLSPDTFGH